MRNCIWLGQVPKMNQGDEEGETGVITIKKQKVKRPPRYKVLMHNDDYTTMEFVVYVLKVVFNKNETEAQAIMLSIHSTGVGVCGIYSYEIAETKAAKVVQMAKNESHPLMCTIEAE